MQHFCCDVSYFCCDVSYDFLGQTFLLSIESCTIIEKKSNNQLFKKKYKKMTF